MQIVTDISNIISQHINMMDESGLIIASTDPARVGTFHEAALRIINERLSSLVIHEDYEYEGAKKGLNLPVMLDNVIVGVIGVTGEYEVVSKYGQIIKKMTEILILENYSQEQKKIDDRIKTRFLDEWIFEDAPGGYGREFIERGNRLGIDITIPRRVLLAEITDIAKYTDSAEGQKLIDRINKTVRTIVEHGGQNVFAKTPSQMICLILDCEDRSITVTAHEIIEQVKNQFGIDVMIGIDKKSARLNQAYQRAKKALAAGRYANESVYFYDSITVEIFIDEISGASKREFLTRIFRGFGEREMPDWINFLNVYFANNGSLEKTAVQLYIHKNTVQNRLNKLTEQTGRDPRKIMDAALFVLAIQFYEEDLRHE
jgi:carbohydrate diacid regulator